MHTAVASDIIAAVTRQISAIDFPIDPLRLE
jgi:hypothetical protein